MPSATRACLPLVVAIVTATGASAQDKIAWAGDLKGGLAEAKKTGRPVLVDFGAEWCGACKKLDAAAFRNPGVIGRVATGFVAVRVDCDRDAALATRFDVTSLPTLLVLSADGKELGRRTGSAGAAEVAAWLAPFAAKPAGRPAPAPTPTPAADPWLVCHQQIAAALDRAAVTPPAASPGGR